MVAKAYFKEWIAFRGLTQRRVAERMSEHMGKDYGEDLVSKLVNGKLKRGWQRNHIEAFAFAVGTEPGNILNPPTSEDELAIYRRVRAMKPDEQARIRRIIEAASDGESTVSVA